MLKRALLWAIGAATAAGVAIAAAAGNGFRDVLDTPALKSQLASRALLNGLASAGQRIVAVGQRGHILYSDDGGENWTQAEVPLSSDLVAVAFAGEKSGWTVGHDGVVLRSTDAGAAWTRQLDGRSAGALMLDYYTREAKPGDGRLAAALDEAKKFAAQGAENPLLDVWFESETNGIAVGAFGLALRTRDGGASWEPMLHVIDNPKALHLYAVRGIAGDIYIAGEQGLLLKLDRASGEFRALELPYKGTLFGIVGNERAVLVHGLRGTALRSTDGGRSWQPVETRLQVGLTGSTADRDGRIVVVSQAGHILVSSDDGASFKAAKVERPIPAAAVIATGKDSVVVAGPRGVQSQTLQ
ncbi:MAG: glycosyl hydrolase [Burkholderiales bacterium]|nr:glycosyl hydrolase [Burkholderiales bacterium]